jgi:hypothetical protein
MYNFCTLFDSNYLLRGLAMYDSLVEHCADFHLYIFSFDDKGTEILNKLGLPKTTIITLKEFEDEKLLSVKSGRTRAEYCWTCTSSTILYCIEKYGLDMCTYLDADMLFFDSPKVLFDEMGDKSIMITEHRFHPDHDKSWNSGKYCVQFMVFKNNEDGMRAIFSAVP